MGLYQHTNIREMTSEQIQTMIQARQDQRLLTAIEAKNAREAKISKLSAKDQEKYTKLGNKIVTRLAKIGEMIDLCDTELRSMQSLSNNITLFQQELGDDE